MTWTGALLWIRRVKLLPILRLNVVPVEVIDTIITIVATEDEDTTTVNYSSVSVTWAGRLRTSICIELRPGVSGKIEAVEVIATVGAVVAAENIEVVVHGDRCVE